jgi:DUF4097 and DUF4098 domain-containing protein YvlB
MKKWLNYSLLIIAAVTLATANGLAQKKVEGPMECRDSWGNDRLQNHCEIREQAVPMGGTIDVDAGRNGGVSVKGWDKSEILVRAQIRTAALTLGEAEELAKQVVIQTSGLKIRAEGPSERRDFNWWVSYEVWVPRHSDLSLQAHNGGIGISDVSGKIEFTALNGGVSLRRVGGNVHGSTTNGGLSVELSGDRWDGEELDVSTTNGGVSMSVPENYSAHLETGTVNGNVSVDFPVTVQGRITKELSLNLGSGGATVRAMTTNGGIRLKRATAN